MHQRQAIAVEIALQTHVLQTCPVHNEIFCDDDVDPSSAFALAVELVRQHTPYVDEFDQDAHALTDLLSETIGAAPTACPLCAVAHERATGAPARTSLVEHPGVPERTGVLMGLQLV
jgi:hypothetical protein